LPWRFSPLPGRLPKRAIAYNLAAQSWSRSMDYIIGGITTILLFAYLIYALLKPEKF
jgi:K+-transporting ATPase KdpF subunit